MHEDQQHFFFGGLVNFKKTTKHRFAHGKPGQSLVNPSPKNGGKSSGCRSPLEAKPSTLKLRCPWRLRWIFGDHFVSKMLGELSKVTGLTNRNCGLSSKIGIYPSPWMDKLVYSSYANDGFVLVVPLKRMLREGGVVTVLQSGASKLYLGYPWFIWSTQRQRWNHLFKPIVHPHSSVGRHVARMFQVQPVSKLFGTCISVVGSLNPHWAEYVPIVLALGLLGSQILVVK